MTIFTPNVFAFMLVLPIFFAPIHCKARDVEVAYAGAGATAIPLLDKSYVVIPTLIKGSRRIVGQAALDSSMSLGALNKYSELIPQSVRDINHVFAEFPRVMCTYYIPLGVAEFGISIGASALYMYSTKKVSIASRGQFTQSVNFALSLSTIDILAKIDISASISQPLYYPNQDEKYARPIFGARLSIGF